MRLFRERLLARLVDSHAISPELAAKLLPRKHPGFSAHVGEPIEPENKEHIVRTGLGPPPPGEVRAARPLGGRHCRPRNC